MDKLVLAGPVDEVGLADEPEAIVAAAAHSRGKRRDEVRVMVLDKPRHTELVERLRATGCMVVTPAAGDVAGALSVLSPSAGVDLLLGVGGTPEGVLAACAVRALGGFMQGRLAPQRDDERAALRDAGADLDAIIGLDTLVAGNATFIATGVTGGLLDAPRSVHGAMVTDSLVIADGAIHRLRQTTPTKE
jgi:fructose-1,6-bisphosphatase II